MKNLVKVQFTRHYDVYNSGEIAGFSAAKARALVGIGAAVVLPAQPENKAAALRQAAKAAAEPAPELTEEPKEPEAPKRRRKPKKLDFGGLVEK